MPGDQEADEDLLLGRSLDDRYRIEARIGQGGMGAVYRGRHLMMDRVVAIKILRPDLANDQDAVRRFAREAKGTFRFDHPNCVRVFDFGFAAERGVLYLIMEYLDGRTVGDEIRVDGPMNPDRVARVAAQAAKALSHAHALGAVHRDLKPDNIMLVAREGNPDFVKVLDFGLAKLFEADSTGTLLFSRAAITQDGMVFGTPEYMSPEQATGKSLSPASDVYALGVVMYEMATGLLPFNADGFMAVLSKQVRETPIAPAARRPELGIPAQLDELIMACLAKSPAKRPQTAAELAHRLQLAEQAALAAPTRVPKNVAASETMDLSAQMAPIHIAGAPQAGVATAPTVATDAARQPESTDWPKRGPGGARLALALLVPLVVIGGIVAALVAFSAGPSSSVDGGPATSARVASDSGAGLEATADGGPPSAAEDANGGNAAPTGMVDAGPGRASPDAASQPDRAREQRRKVRAEIAAHLRAANSARTAGNSLKQIAEADGALRLDPNNKRAAYLLGDALVRSGDKARGCRYLRKARGLSQARARAREAGCN